MAGHVGVEVDTGHRFLQTTALFPDLNGVSDIRNADCLEFHRGSSLPKNLEKVVIMLGEQVAGGYRYHAHIRRVRMHAEQ